MRRFRVPDLCTITGIIVLDQQPAEWSRDDCPHNVKCTSERACKRYEAHKNRVRSAQGWPFTSATNGRDEG